VLSLALSAIAGAVGLHACRFPGTT
jgi:hypothetical protein